MLQSCPLSLLWLAQPWLRAGAAKFVVQREGRGISLEEMGSLEPMVIKLHQPSRTGGCDPNARSECLSASPSGSQKSNNPRRPAQFYCSEELATSPKPYFLGGARSLQGNLGQSSCVCYPQQNRKVSIVLKECKKLWC